MDSLGLILLVVVHPANIQDRDGAKILLRMLTERFGWLKLIWADGGYTGKLVQWVYELQRKRPIQLDIVRRCDNTKEFKILPKRWIVERTFGWLSKYRRMAKDYETTTESSVAIIHIAMSRMMLKRAARFSNA